MFVTSYLLRVICIIGIVARMKKYLLLSAAAFFVLVGYFYTPPSTWAQDVQDILYESINPKDGYRYVFKRLGEKITMVVLSFSPDKKVDYYQKLIEVRLRELKYVVDTKDLANIQTVNQRYFSTAGQTTEYVKKNNLSQHKEKLRNLFTEHLGVLEVLKKSFNDTTAEWRFLEHNVDYLKIYTTQLLE